MKLLLMLCRLFPSGSLLLCHASADILQLIAESKALRKIGFHLPEPAHLVMLQETRFKSYFDELTDMLRQYADVIKKIPAVLLPAMDPLLRDLELRMVGFERSLILLYTVASAIRCLWLHWCPLLWTEGL